MKRVGVLMGGMSTEREVSLESGRAVARALRSRGHDVVDVDVGPDVADVLRKTGVEVAWLALHGAFGEDGCIQGLLEIMGIPYTGSGVLASALAMDKITTKRVLAGSGLALPEDWVFRNGDEVPAPPFPVVAKTPRGGSTLGIELCKTPGDLEGALVRLQDLDEVVLIEQCIQGEEITVAVLDGQPLPVVAIRAKSGFFDFEAKYTKGQTEYLVPAPIEAQVAQRASRDAVVAYSSLGLRGIARADFIVDAQGTPWFLEINTIPGMTATSLSPMAAAQTGMSFEDLVVLLLRGARLDNSRP